MASREEYMEIARRAESQYGLPTGTMSGLIEQESAWNPKAKSSAGALGLTQIVPKYHPTVNPQMLLDDPAYAIEQGARILSERYKARQGDLGLALTDYHSGQGNVNKFIAGNQDALGPVGKSYAPSVIGRMRKYGADIPPTAMESVRQRFGAVGNTETSPAVVAQVVADQAVTDTALTAEEIIRRLTTSETDVAKAQTQVDTVAINQKSELAKQSQEILTMLGLNPDVTNSEIAATAVTLKNAHGDLVRTQDELRTDRQDPIFNVIDMFTGGKISQVQNQRIAQSVDTVKQLTDSLVNLQNAAGKQIALGATASYSLAEQEVKARADLNQAKADANITRLGIDSTLKIERQQAADQIRTARLELDEEKAKVRAIMDQARIEQMARGKPLSITDKLKESQLEALNSLYSDTAKAMGFTDEEYIQIISDKRYAHLKDYTVDADGKLPLALAKLKAARGKMSQAELRTFQEAHNPTTGWASPGNPNNANQLTETGQAMFEQIRKGKKIDAGTEAEIVANESTIIATRKKSLIVNDGTETTLKENPYGANFYRLEQYAASPTIARANPIVGQVVQSPLYKEIQKKNAGNSADKRSVSDAEVVDTAAQMMRTKQLTPEQAAKQVSDYYKAQVAVNNQAYGFGAMGLPEQDNYPVPVLNNQPTNNWIQAKVEASGKKNPDGSIKAQAAYKAFDLTNETQVNMLLLARQNPSLSFGARMLSLAPIFGAALTAVDSFRPGTLEQINRPFGDNK